MQLYPRNLKYPYIPPDRTTYDNQSFNLNYGFILLNSLTADIQKEADRMLRVVSSPYLVTIMGLLKNPGDVGIVMEYFEYGSLKEFEEKYMQCDCWARKVKMVHDIALGMNYLHTLNPPIIHRDLKLENVFVGGGFEAKVRLKMHLRSGYHQIQKTLALTNVSLVWPARRFFHLILANT